MSRQSRDPWRIGAIERLGAQLRDLESADRRVQARATRSRRRRVSISGGLAATLIAILALVVTDRVAHALSPINRAPAAAAASESVRLHSTITITLNGRQYGRFTEHGEIDFARRNYGTTLQLGQGEAVEQRRVDGVLYIAQLPGGRRRRAPIRWLGFPLAHEAATTFASAPESAEFTSPLVLLDELGGTRAPVKVVGTEDLHGVPTTRYRLQTNLASLLSASPSPGAGSPPLSYRGIGATLTVWLDAHGRPRRVDETVAGASSGGEASITTLTDFTGYGQPVAVRAPTKLSVTAKRRIMAPGPLAASPSRSFERLLFGHR